MVKKILLIILLFIAHSSLAGAAKLAGVKGSLKAIEKSVYSAANTAESTYTQNGGANLSAPLSLINGNIFLQSLEILVDYKIRLQFATSDPNTTYGIIPVAKVLTNKIITLVPILSEDNTRITAWECVTNADDGLQEYIGDNSMATIGNLSFISQNNNSGDNPYLSNCIFITTADLNNIFI